MTTRDSKIDIQSYVNFLSAPHISLWKPLLLSREKNHVEIWRILQKVGTYNYLGWKKMLCETKVVAKYTVPSFYANSHSKDEYKYAEFYLLE